MAETSTFHGFTALPTELRLKIWKLSLRPHDESRVEIHKFAVVWVEDAATSVGSTVLGGSYDPEQGMYALAIPNITEDCNANNSAYLWDAGLWKACWESYEVMKSYYNLHLWQQGIRDDGLPLLDGNWTKSLDYLLAATAAPCQPSDKSWNRPWQMIVKPYRDAFYFDYNSLRQGMLHDLGFKPAGEWGNKRPLRHFLVDFDWTWHRSLPGYLPALEEPTKLFFVLDREHLDKDEVSGSYDDDRRIFYDCAEEFEEVKNGDNIRSWATMFVKELEFRHGDFYDKVGCPYGGFGDSHRDDCACDNPRFLVRDHIGVLRPRKLPHNMSIS
ncbi:hypothetical protein S7711_01369 [Stachybotrys chartarum IBT 7711]|uniref:2EXR domain-containing protein n=1 Tax=Stachybotrys chartarum (strain CBS 109288 / IBT 7711) TaxID=1280523 RepID=A0A084BBV4_STACB|nr:hypothetical protein S7711_01369 [Stachybotrys chartarum IBT 7711]KFA51889.1 hypothetical protein S40293_04128 [Stachybotrys chartarum IBT 40293]